MSRSASIHPKPMEKNQKSLTLTVLETLAARLTAAEQLGESDHHLLVQVDATANGIEHDVSVLDRKLDKIIELLTPHMAEQAEQNRKTNERLLALERQRKVPNPHPAPAR